MAKRKACLSTCDDGDFVPQEEHMATYEARLATFVVHDWKPRGFAQPETLATYGFGVTRVTRDAVHGNLLEASCKRCDGRYWNHEYDDHHWIGRHKRWCPFREAALREDSSAQIDDLRQQTQTLRRQVDALERQKQALEKEVEEYAIVKTALRTALGL